MSFLRTRAAQPALIILIVLVLAAIYAQVRHFEYVWDDRALFVSSPALRVIGGLQDFWAAISAPILPGTTYFRPVVMASFVAEFGLFGVSPAVSHGVNIALFLTNVLLVGWLARRIVPSDTPALPQVLAMVMYGFHPANSEAACWVAGRFDLMVTTFGLAMLLALVTLRGGVRLAVASLCFLLACLSKEMAVVLPMAAFVLVELQRPPTATWRQRMQDWLSGSQRNLALALFGTGLVYLIIRAAAVPAMAHVDKSLAAALTPWTHVVYVGRATWFYLQTTLLPFLDLSPQHPLHVSDLQPMDTIKALAALALAAGLMVAALIRRTPVVSLLALAVASLAPVLHIIPLSIGGNIGHERFLTLPLAFAALGFSLAMTRAWAITKWRRLNALALSGWTAVAALNLLVTVPLWRSDPMLWRWAYTKYPDANYIQSSLLSSLTGSGDLAGARQALAEIKTRRGDGDNLNLLMLEAHLDVRDGRPAIGLEKLRGAVPRYERKLASMAPFYYGNRPEAVSLATKDNYATLRFGYSAMSEAHLRLRQFDQAAAAARVALHHDPTFPPAHFALALALYGANKWDEGQASLRDAQRLYVPSAFVGSLRLRQQFLDIICQGDNIPRTTCDAWQLERQAAEQPAAQRPGG